MVVSFLLNENGILQLGQLMEWAACHRQGDQCIRVRKSLGASTLKLMTNLFSASARYAHLAPEEFQPP